ncbi:MULTISPECIES: chemotaxis protein CheW [Acutalibacteraceae]|uniref:chemotaxis protein CheW n=1 Tax=Acutalibacteraceae TaxID=3082771 RepID=UPI001FA952FC|nr:MULTISPECIES: chemotaxis protein CheW [Acutalibacteraceae]
MQNNLAEEGIGQDSEQAALMTKYLTFWTDGELFGLPISDVVQIISMQGITPLPDFPDYAKGVINLRGNIIPVIDIRVRFGKPEAEYNENTCIIVTSIEDSYMGFIVDAVDEVTDLDEDSISPPPKVSKDITNRYLTGIGQIEEKVILLLDVAKILSENELTEVHETAAQNKSAEAADKHPETPVVDLRAAAVKKNEGE